MESETLTFGRLDALHGVLEWRAGYGTQGPVGKTWGDLSISIGHSLVWGRRDEFGTTEKLTWSWIDMLEFLTTAWPHLLADQTCPIPLDETKHTRTLIDLRGRAFHRWSSRCAIEADDEDDALRDFLVVHDLGEALVGASAPTLVLLKQGDHMRAASARHEWLLPFADTMAALSELGNVIAKRITTLDDARSLRACARWLARTLHENQCSPSAPNQTSGR